MVAATPLRSRTGSGGGGGGRGRGGGGGGGTGHREEADRLLRALLAAPGRVYLPPIPVAKAYAGLGDADAAFRWLERGYDERAAQMRTVNVTPAFDALHGDARWSPLMRRVGFEP
jgi:hypothetical protein